MGSQNHSKAVSVSSVHMYNERAKALDLGPGLSLDVENRDWIKVLAFSCGSLHLFIGMQDAKGHKVLHALASSAQCVACCVVREARTVCCVLRATPQGRPASAALVKRDR